MNPRRLPHRLLHAGLLAGTLVVVTATAEAADNIAYWNGNQLITVSGCAQSIGVGSSSISNLPSGTPFVIGCGPAIPVNQSTDGSINLNVVYNFPIVEDVSLKWQSLSGAATKIAVAPSGISWAIDALNHVYSWNGSRFVPAGPADGCATSIGVGSVDGADDPWIIGCDPDQNGNANIYQLKDWTGGATGLWKQAPSDARAAVIAVSPFGTPWVINNQHKVFAWDGLDFVAAGPADGCATSIGVGNVNGADVPWVTGCTLGARRLYGIYSLQQWAGGTTGTWRLAEDDAATGIAVSATNEVWVTTTPVPTPVPLPPAPQ